MSESEQGNGNGHGESTEVARRLEALEPHPYLLAEGFSKVHIQQAGWRVEKLGERHVTYGLPEDAAGCEAWFIPYLHPNGHVWFERGLFIHEEDRARYGRHPDSSHRQLYDPFLVLSTDNPEPRDAVLLVHGEANTVAADALIPAFGVVGIPEDWTLSAAMASYLGHIPCVYVWLDRSRAAAAEHIHWIAERLREAGVQEVRQLPDAPMTAREALRELGSETAVEAADDMLRRAERVEEGEEPWPLVPCATPPRFPVDALPEPIAAFVEAVAARTRTPPDMAAMGALGVLATVAMGLSIDCVDWEEEALPLYTLTISPSGDHKSAVLKTVAAPLYRIDAEQREDAKAKRAEHAARQETLALRKKALTDKVRKLSAAAVSLDQDEQDVEWGETQKALEEVSAELAENEEFVEPRLLTDDSTPEGLARLMAKHPDGIAVASAEAAIVNNLLGHYSDKGQANLAAVNKAFNGEGPVFVDRGQADPLYIPRALLSITLFAQPGVLAKVLAHEEARDQGLIGRFVYADLEPASTLGHRDYSQRQPKVPSHLQETWDQIVRRVKASCARTKGTKGPDSGPGGGFVPFVRTSEVGDLQLTLSPSSHKLLTELLVALEPRQRPGGDLRPFADWMARHHGRIARIAAYLHLATRPLEEPISEATMRAALRIGEYLLQHMLIALSAPDPVVRRALAWLERADTPDVVSQRELQRGPLNKRGTADDAGALAQKLVSLGALRIQMPSPTARPQGGRPPGPRYRVNPQLRRGRS